MANVTITFTVTEFCLRTGVTEEDLNEIVGLGVIEPYTETADSWQFDDHAATVVQRALRLKTAKEYSDTAKREVSVDVDALLAAINEISESEVHRSQNDSEHVSVDGREYHTWRELADAFELDIHDFSVSEVNR